jgi:hypothetical protein
MKPEATIYAPHTYLRLDQSTGFDIYSLSAILWMPANYSLSSIDHEPPAGTNQPATLYFRLLLLDSSPDVPDDLSTCKPLFFLNENIGKNPGIELIQVHYIVSNQTIDKIPKKPKSKTAYAHADVGGSGPLSSTKTSVNT